MATRAFKIFVDASSTSASSSKSASRSSRRSTTPSPMPNNEKENIDPNSGLTPSSSKSKSKTKTPGRELRPKASRSNSAPSSSTVAKKSTTPAKKKKSAFGSNSTNQIGFSFTLDSFSVAEQEEEGESEGDRRARELTVIPLADLSEAYSASSANAPASEAPTRRSPPASIGSPSTSEKADEREVESIVLSTVREASPSRKRASTDDASDEAETQQSDVEASPTKRARFTPLPPPTADETELNDTEDDTEEPLNS